jgi:hypothetical protein
MGLCFAFREADDSLGMGMGMGTKTLSELKKGKVTVNEPFINAATSNADIVINMSRV